MVATRQNGRVVDHIVGTPQCTLSMSAVRVLRYWFMSDHYPVKVGLTVQAACGSNLPTHDGRGEATHRRIRMKRDTDVSAIANSNYWAPLGDLLDETTANQTCEADTQNGRRDGQAVGNQVAKQWIENHKKIADELRIHTGLSQKPNSTVNTVIKRAVLRKRKLNYRLLNVGGRSVVEQIELENELQQATEVARALIKRDKSERFCKRIQKASKDLRDPRECRNFWKWASNTAGWKTKRGVAGIQPVRDPDTNVGI